MPEVTSASMSSKYGFDLMDGKQVPQLVVSGDYVMTGVHKGSVHVEKGTLNLLGVLKGSLDVQNGANATIFGSQEGSVSIAPRASVIVTGAIHGSTYIDEGGLLVVEAGGRLAGTLANNGKVILRGVFGGQSSGVGQFIREQSGHIKKPITRDGITFYEW